VKQKIKCPISTGIFKVFLKGPYNAHLHVIAT